MINKDTILSVYTDKQTLLEYLTAIEKALDNAVLVSADIVDEGSNKCHFVFTFEDDTKIITPTIEFIKPVKGATIRNGVLYLTLADGTEVSAGSITASFGASTFTGNVLVNGNLQVNGNQTETGNLQVNGYIKQNSYELDTDLGLTLTTDAQNDGFSIYYQHARVSNGKLNIVVGITQAPNAYTGTPLIINSDFTIDSSIGSKLYPALGSSTLVLEGKNSVATNATGEIVTSTLDEQLVIARVIKGSGTRLVFAFVANLKSTTYYHLWRFEFNFILS